MGDDNDDEAALLLDEETHALEADAWDTSDSDAEGVSGSGRAGPSDSARDEEDVGKADGDRRKPQPERVGASVRPPPGRRR